MRAGKARTGRRAGQTCHRRRNAYGRPQGKGRMRGSPRSSTTSPLNCWRRRSTRWRRTQPPAWIGGRGRTTRQTSNTISRTCINGSNAERIGHCRLGAYTSPSRTVSSARSRSPQSHRTALLSHQPLGSAEVTHPFHPLHGQRFVVLKVRRVAGVETLSLRHHDLGSFAMALEWTDWAPPGASAVSAGKSLMIDAFGLLSLTELVTSLTRNGGLDR